MKEFNKLLIIILGLLLGSCVSKQDYRTIQQEIILLKKEKDSLSRIVEEIKGKYIFDSIAIHQTSDKSNTKKLNSIYKSDFFVVGYGINNLSFIECDSVSYNPLRLYNADTLNHSRGIFKFEKKLLGNKNKLKIRMNLKSKYGKSKNSTIDGIIKISP